MLLAAARGIAKHGEALVPGANSPVHS